MGTAFWRDGYVYLISIGYGFGIRDCSRAAWKDLSQWNPEQVLVLGVSWSCFWSVVAYHVILLWRRDTGS